MEAAFYQQLEAVFGFDQEDDQLTADLYLEAAQPSNGVSRSYPHPQDQLPHVEAPEPKDPVDCKELANCLVFDL